MSSGGGPLPLGMGGPPRGGSGRGGGSNSFRSRGRGDFGRDNRGSNNFRGRGGMDRGRGGSRYEDLFQINLSFNYIYLSLKFQ